MSIALKIACCAIAIMYSERVVGQSIPPQPAASDPMPSVTAIAVAQDKTKLLVGSQYGIQSMDWPSMTRPTKLSVDMEHVHDLCFSPNGRFLLVAGGSPGESGSLELFDWPSLHRIHRFEVHSDVIYRIAWSQDGNRYATASADASCRVFNSDDHREITRYVGHSRSVVSIAFLAGSSQLVSAGADATIRIWSAFDGQHIRTLDNHVGPIHAIAVSDASKSTTGESWIVSASEDRTVRIWQPQLGRMVRFAKLPSIPCSLAISSDANRIFVGCEDGSLRILDVDSATVSLEKELSKGRIQEIHTVNESTLVTGGHMGVQRYNLE